MGANGQVSLYNQSGSTDLVVDIDGWYDTGGASAAGGTLHPVNPQRVLDTRDGTGLPGHVAAPMGPGSTVHLPVTTLASLPAGATAVVLNLTSTNATSSSFITAWADGTAQPLASSLNPEAGQVDSNLVVVPIGANGDVNLLNALGRLDLIGDLAGWFGNPADAHHRSPGAPVAGPPARHPKRDGRPRPPRGPVGHPDPAGHRSGRRARHGRVGGGDEPDGGGQHHLHLHHRLAERDGPAPASNLNPIVRAHHVQPGHRGRSARAGRSTCST